jgi:hypothetical protein
MMATVAGLAFVMAAFIGRARHADEPSTVDQSAVVAPVASAG